MDFRILGLGADEFEPLFDLDDAALHARGARRVVAGETGGYPCRISLTDARPGDELVLTNYEHQCADSPFRARHAIYVRRGETRYDAVNAVPEQLRRRLLSVRGFDAEGMLTGADVVDGPALETAIEALLGNPRASYLQVHFAKAGCYAARVERA